MSNIFDVTIDNFDDLMSRELLVLDFYTNSCQPCKQFMPVFTDFADRGFGGATYGKVDAEANPDLTSVFQVRAVPTIIVVKNRVEVARKSGVLNAKDFETLISNH